jgi:BirA family biotin operon repressor/biotin-[acetyl-CoA-carboxylase] ligase
LRLLHLDTVTSTMDVARELLLTGQVNQDRAGRLSLRGVTAQEQTAGRGQRGRGWYSPPGASLSVTYYFRHGITDPASAGHISLLAGVAAANALSTICRREAKRKGKAGAPHSSTPSPLPARVALKWPNDLLLNDKKVGGILVEMALSPMLGWIALIGIGINVAVQEFPSELAQSATSLWREGVQTCGPDQIAESMARSLNRMAAAFGKEGLPDIVRRWRSYDGTTGRRYRLEQHGMAIEGIAEGIDDFGALLLRSADGRLHSTSTASSIKEIAGVPRTEKLL